MFKSKKKDVCIDRNVSDINRLYDISSLVIGRLQRMNNLRGNGGPSIESTKQRYVFEVINDKDVIKYKEIFTGYVAFSINNTILDGYDTKYFGFPYVYDIEDFSNYFDRKDKTVSKLDLIWLLNDINYIDVKKKVKDL